MVEMLNIVSGGAVYLPSKFTNLCHLKFSCLCGLF